VMNLFVIAALTTLVTIEKVVPTGEHGRYAIGGVLIALGISILVKS
jgi:predicted metal-binding membrane protein